MVPNSPKLHHFFNTSKQNSSQTSLSSAAQASGSNRRIYTQHQSPKPLELHKNRLNHDYFDEEVEKNMKLYFYKK